jgi:hypothetical protein
MHLCDELFPPFNRDNSPLTSVGEIKRKTQARVLTLFRRRLGYDYPGNRSDGDNRNIEPDLLTTGLRWFCHLIARWLVHPGVARRTGWIDHLGPSFPLSVLSFPRKKYRDINPIISNRIPP